MPRRLLALVALSLAIASSGVALADPLVLNAWERVTNIGSPPIGPLLHPIQGGFALAHAADARNRWWYIREGRTIHRLHLDELGRYEQVYPEGEGPTPRTNQGVVWDSTESRLLFCGGLDSTGKAIGDLWELTLTDPPRWRFLLGSALPLGTSVAIDPVRRYLYATTRLSNLTYVWRLDLAADSPVWTPRFPAIPITPTFLACDAVANRLLGFGGYQEATTIGLGSVDLVTTPTETRPGPYVGYPAFAFDSRRNRIYIHNGAERVSFHTVSFRVETDAFGSDGGSTFTDPGVTGEEALPDLLSIGIYDAVADRMLLLNGLETYWDANFFPYVAPFDGLWTLQFDSAVPTRLDLLDVVADVGGDAIRVRFAGEGPFGEVRVERAPGGEAIDDWSDVGAATEGTPGIYEFLDANVVAGNVYRYRGRWFEDGVERTTAVSAPVRIGSGSLALSLRPRGGTVVGRGPIEFVVVLPGAGPAMLELVDVAGRRLERRVLEGGSPGSRTVALAPGVTDAAGVLFARLRQGDHAAVVRLVRY